MYSLIDVPFRMTDSIWFFFEIAFTRCYNCFECFDNSNLSSNLSWHAVLLQPSYPNYMVSFKLVQHKQRQHVLTMQSCTMMNPIDPDDPDDLGFLMNPDDLGFLTKFQVHYQDNPDDLGFVVNSN